MTPNNHRHCLKEELDIAASPYLSSSAIIRHAIERVTGDPHQARREVVGAILSDLLRLG